MGRTSGHLSILTLVAGSLLLLGAAPSRGVVKADWLVKPAGEEIGKVYPDEAMRRSESGRVELACVAKTDGTLADCEVVLEDPPGFGFAKAGLSLTAQMRMKPMTVDGEPRESRVRIPLNFSTTDAQQGLNKLPWERRADCAAVTLDNADAGVFSWPPGEEQHWYDLYVTTGLRQQKMTTAQLLGQLRARVTAASARRQPAGRAPALAACHRLLTGDER